MSALDTEPSLAAATASPLRRDAAPERAAASPSWRGKRAFDVVLAAGLLVLTGPLLLLIALAVRMETPGPALFRQQRYGRGLCRFVILKFRTMHEGVSPELHRRFIAELATAGDDAGGDLKKLTRDPRVTRVGAFLRRTSLDELPQLINVLRGEMSIVGPRPAVPYELEHYAPEHYARFDVRPGLTGLWQVSGRSAVGFLEMLTLDAVYARTASPRIDAMILLRTPWAVVRRNAA